MLDTRFVFGLLLLIHPLGHARAVPKSLPKAPLAAERPHALVAHGDLRQDPYYWLRDKTNPETVAYLNAENTYAASRFARFATPGAKIFGELKKHVNATDETVAHREGAWLYWQRLDRGREYPVYLRRPVAGEARARAQVLLDGNQLAAGHDFADVGTRAVSDDGQTLAYSVDLVGDHLYTIYLKDLKTGRFLSDRIQDTDGTATWSADGSYLYYAKPEPQTLRTRWVYRHHVGAHEPDVVIYEDKDPQYEVGVGRSLSNRLIFVTSHSLAASEVSYFAAAEPLATPKLFQARRPGLVYSVSDGVDRFFVRTNLGAESFRVVETPLDQTSTEHWTDVVPARADVHLNELWVFKTHLVVTESKDGLTRFSLLARDPGAKAAGLITFEDSDYFADSGTNLNYDATFFRYGYESLARPERVIDVDLVSGKKIVRHTRRVPGFDAKRYATERLWVTAEDGARVPVSLVYRRGLERGPRTPILLTGYGSYGSVLDSYFTISRLPLLDRGFVYAVAHVRGGGELGRPWYLDGKLMKKKNTFTDFLSVARALVRDRWTSPAHLYAEGESAGGLLMGVVANTAPDLFKGIIAKVPFVDVLTTMLDATLPLTTGEYVEWGNPNQKPAYDYMKSYSPYDNVRAQNYPHLLVRTAFNDSNVGYWEPAKWVAKLRHVKADDHLLLLTTEMSTGHDGKNGRYSWLEQVAEDISFLLELERSE